MLGAAAVDRVATINDVRDAGAGRHVSHLTLRVDNAQGGEDLIRIDMRGLAVDAQIDLGDLRDVDRMSGRVGELREALERHGLSSDTVRISSAGRAAEAAAADGHRTALAAAAVGGASAGSDAGGAGSQQSASQRDAQRDSQRDQQQPGGRDAASAHTGRDGQQQQGRRDDRQGRGAEPWLAEDDVLARARRASTTQPPR
jgi:hypothetical protein